MNNTMNKKIQKKSLFEEWQNSITWHIFLTFIVVMFCVFLWWRLAITYQKSLIERDQVRLLTISDNIATHLTSEINRRQSILTALSASAKTHPTDELRNQHFQTFAASLIDNDPVIRVIQYYPVQGPVLVYPIEGNEAVIGRTLEDLIHDERDNVREDVKRTIDSRKITLSDPYELRQGGLGIVSRFAVYDEDDFLGIVVVTLDIKTLLELPSVSVISSSSHFALSDTKGSFIYGNESVYESNDVQSTIILPEGEWQLKAVFPENWKQEIQKTMVIFWGYGILLICLMATSTYLLSSRQSTMSNLVKVRTAELEESNSRYTTALRIVNEGVWDWNIQTGIQNLSNNCYEILGYQYPANSLQTYQDWLAHIHPEDIDSLKANIFTAVDNASEFTCEYRARHKDGHFVTLLSQGSTIETDFDGKTLRMLGTIRDITQQKKLEQQLRESETKFRSLFENSRAIMLLIDPQSGRIIDANPSACEFYGWNLSEIREKNITVINQLPIDEVKSAMKLAIENNAYYFQFQHQLADGSIRDVDVYGSPVPFNDQVLLFSIIHDVTAKKQAEKALEESETRYRMILQLAPIGLAIYSENQIVFVNSEGAKLLGYRYPDEIIGASLEKFIPEKELTPVLESIEHIMYGEIETSSSEITMKRSDGSFLQTEIFTIPIIYMEKPAIQVIGIDVSERKKAEEIIRQNQYELSSLLTESERSRKALLSIIEDYKIAEQQIRELNAELEKRVQERTAQLEAANKELEAFSYSVSHDLRAPLRGIDGWSMAFLEDYGSQLDNQAKEYLQRVRSETQKMGHLIDDLLRLSRVTRSEMSINQVDLSQIVQRIFTELLSEQPDRKIEIDIEPKVIALGDSNLLEIVLTNLLSNAFKFTSKQDIARIEFGQKNFEGRMIYYVTDNGAGFDMAYAKNLFGAFQRMHKQSEFPGTGIGLATVQRIIHRHSGEIWAEAAKNEGAKFYFTLGANK